MLCIYRMVILAGYGRISGAEEEELTVLCSIRLSAGPICRTRILEALIRELSGVIRGIRQLRR